MCNLIQGHAQCPGAHTLLENVLKENTTEHVTFNQWIYTHRATPETTVNSD
jgi:hypothetical protein